MKKTELKVEFKEPLKMAKTSMPVKEELDCLELMIKSFEQLDENAKFRCMKYFINRFDKYVSPSDY